MLDAPRRQVLVVSPFGLPDPGPVVAAVAAGATGVLDLGTSVGRAAGALLLTRSVAPGPVAVRVPPRCPLTAAEVLAAGPGRPVDLVLLADGAPWTPGDVAVVDARVSVLVEVTSVEQACAAVAAGALGVVAVGSEAGGRVGELGAAALFHRLTAALDGPVWVRGGIVPRGAAGLVAAGAAGVVLDAQLALLPDCATPRHLRDMLERMASGDPVDGDPVGRDGVLATLFAAACVDVRAAVRLVQEAIARPDQAVELAAVVELPRPPCGVGRASET